MEVKKISLQSYIVKFILKVGLSFIMLLCIFSFTLSYMVKFHILRYASYSQDLLEKSRAGIKNAREITPELIPQGLEYVVIDKNTLSIKKGDMNKTEIKIAMQCVKNNNTVIGADIFGNVYEMIERREDYCVVHYKLITQFVNPILRNLIPYPGFTMMILLIIALLLDLYILSLHFSNKMKEELNKFRLVTEKIEKRDLDFEVQNSSFTEYQKVMDSLDDLRYSLKKSLTSQFKQEENKREQISALAHDIKIPITVIKGNAELLSITQKDENILDYTNEITQATDQIQKYTQLLIDASKSDEAFTIHKQKGSINEFLRMIEKDSISVIGNRGIQFRLDNNIPEEITWNIDCISMKRAFMNVILNGIEHTPDGTQLHMEAFLNDNMSSFTITDCGEGFSKEALKEALKLFYTDNKSRSGTGHYGIGLAFADKVIRAHNGILHLQNDIHTGGGQVVILIPI